MVLYFYKRNNEAPKETNVKLGYVALNPLGFKVSIVNGSVFVLVLGSLKYIYWIRSMSDIYTEVEK